MGWFRERWIRIATVVLLGKGKEFRWGCSSTSRGIFLDLGHLTGVLEDNISTSVNVVKVKSRTRRQQCMQEKWWWYFSFFQGGVKDRSVVHRAVELWVWRVSVLSDLSLLWLSTPVWVWAWPYVCTSWQRSPDFHVSWACCHWYEDDGNKLWSLHLQRRTVAKY